MADIELIKAMGPAGMGVFAGYLMLKEVISFFKTRNGNGVSHILTTQKIYETMISMKSEAERQTDILKEISEKLSP